MNDELYASDIRWRLESTPVEHSDETPLVDALLDGMAYRTTLQETLHALAAVAQSHDRLEARYHRVLDELKALR